MDTTDKTKSAISTSALSTPQTPIIPINPVYDVNGYTTGANQSGAYITSTLQNTQNQAQADADLQKANLANETSSMATLASQLNGQGTNLRNSTIDQANQVTGATDKLNLLNRINAEAQGLQYRKETIIPSELQNKIAGTGMTDRGFAPLETKALRDVSIQLANKAYEAAIASADYNAAKSESDKMINLKYDGVMAEINAKKANIENIRGNLTEAQKKVAEATKLRLEKEKQDELDKKAAETAVNNMLIEASPVAPPDVIAKATKIKNEGGSAVQVAAALGQYGGDFLKNELLKEQIKTQVSNRAMDAEKLRLEKLKVQISQDKADGTNVNGKPLKVTNPEIVNLNETLTARDSVNSLVDAFIKSIKDGGTQVLYGEEAGKRSALQTNLLLAMKSMEKTGALDKGTIDVLTGTIPSNKFFATEAAQVASLEQLKNTINSKADSYVNSYKGTSAELDPRTKRAYESAPINSTGNAAADDYFKKTSAALQNVNATLSTPNAVTAGFTDNQK